MADNELLQSLYTELRRGSLTLAVLSRLQRAHYGYALLQSLQEKGIAIEANTLYPLLRRLEQQGLLASEWDTTESRPRKYYRLSEAGRPIYEQLRAEWLAMQHSLQQLMEEETHGESD